MSQKAQIERKQVRRLINRTIASIETNIKMKQCSAAVIDLDFLREKSERLGQLDKIIQDAYLGEKDIDETLYEQEIDESATYRHAYLQTKHKIDELMTSSFKPETKKEELSTLKLPKIDLKKFDDDPRNWIAFWGQFKKIHESCSLQPEDKFQYLLQGLKEGSKALSLIQSFPPSAENYQKAVNELKSRFGKEDMLIQVYIRELLSLISESKNTDFDLRTLYDKLSTYLMSLESLKIDKEKYETILYPIVESALPENILTAYSRSCTATQKHLASLLEFLKQEVESYESIHMARNNFSFQSTSNKQVNKETIPTAACILSNVRSENQGKNNNICFLCGKNNHSFFQCSKANTMTLEAKKEAI